MTANPFADSIQRQVDNMWNCEIGALSIASDPTAILVVGRSWDKVANRGILHRVEWDNGLPRRGAQIDITDPDIVSLTRWGEDLPFWDAI